MSITRLHLDRNDRLIVAENIQDVEPILEHNKHLQSEPQKSDWGRHVARVPDVMVVKWLNEERARGNTELRYLGPGFDEWFARKIRDPENRAWRTDNPSNPFHLGWRE
jgi:hypothetical protein